jgi:Ring finger domain/RING-like zinc finger
MKENVLSTAAQAALNQRLLLRELNQVKKVPPQASNSIPWAEIKAKCSNGEEECPICLESYQLKSQIILTCSHAFHQICFASYQKLLVNRQIKCPCCRAPFTALTDFDAGANNYIKKCATTIQAFLRGCFIRNSIRFPSGSKLQRSRIQRKLKSFSTRFLTARNLRLSFIESVKDLPIQTSNSSTSALNWSVPLNEALNRAEKECPICLEVLSIEKTWLLSCSHVFHPQCLRTFEQLSPVCCLCPLCKQPYEKTDLVELIK